MNIGNVATISSLTALIGAAATPAMAQVGEASDRYGPYSHGHDMMWSNSQWGGFGMFLGPIFMILILVGIVAAAIYLLRVSGGHGLAVSGHAAHDRAISILKERYAKGEIDSQEFEERKKQLTD